MVRVRGGCATLPGMPKPINLLWAGTEAHEIEIY